MPKTQLIQNYTFKPVIKGDTCPGLSLTVKVGGINDFVGVKVYFILTSSNGIQMLERSTENGGISFLATANPCNLVLGEFPCDFKIGTYLFKMRFQYPTGKTRTYLAGSLKIINE